MEQAFYQTNNDGFVKGGCFFAGANTKDGFVSYYDDIVKDSTADLIINIIGGPGTGKSRLLSTLASFAESVDMICERYFCSSDPGSLDAIKVYNPKNGRIFFACDATAPHPRPFSTPGAVTHIADLSRFWDACALRAKKDNILQLQDDKTKEYRNAYAFISCAGKILSEEYDLAMKNIKIEPMKKRAASLLKCGISDGGLLLLRPVDSISMIGRKRLNNHGFSAYKRMKAENICCSGYVFIKTLANLCKEKNMTAIVSPHPVCPDIFTDIYVPSCSLYVSVNDDETEKTVHCGRLVEKNDLLGMIKKTEKSYESLIDCAVECLGRAKEAHFLLEHLYGNAMDFRSKDEYEKAMVKVVSDIML